VHQTLFKSWKIAALWAIGISASIAAFFSEGGGHEQLAESAQQIREKRGNSYREDAEIAPPVVRPSAAASVPDEEDEPAEPEFGDPSLDPGMGDGEQGEPAPASASAPQVPAGEAEL
jgi:hypothetical protein